MAQGRGFEAQEGQSYAKLERHAQDVRSALLPQNGLVGPIDAIGLFENIDRYGVSVNGRILPLTYASDELPTGCEGHTRFNGEAIVITLSADTYAALERGVPRAKFCFCHELGHACLHGRELVRMAEIPHKVTQLMRVGSHPKWKDTEWQSNGFAAALMMPAAGLLLLETELGRMLDAPTVAERFGVSLKAAEIRLDVFYAKRTELLP